MHIILAPRWSGSWSTTNALLKPVVLGVVSSIWPINAIIRLCPSWPLVVRQLLNTFEIRIWLVSERPVDRLFRASYGRWVRAGGPRRRVDHSVSTARIWSTWRCDLRRSRRARKLSVSTARIWSTWLCDLRGSMRARQFRLSTCVGWRVRIRFANVRESRFGQTWRFLRVEATNRILLPLLSLFVVFSSKKNDGSNNDHGGGGNADAEPSLFAGREA